MRVSPNPDTVFGFRAMVCRFSWTCVCGDVLECGIGSWWSGRGTMPRLLLCPNCQALWRWVHAPPFRYAAQQLTLVVTVDDVHKLEIGVPGDRPSAWIG